MISHRLRFPLFSFILIVAPFRYTASVHAADLSSAVSSGPNQITAISNPDKCLDVDHISKANGAVIHLWDCVGQAQANQLWTLVPITTAAGAGYQIISLNSGLCLDVEGVSTENGAKIQQGQCGGWWALNQVWRLLPFGSSYELVAQNSEKCLDLPGGDQSNGTEFQQWDCGNGYNTNQLFNVVSVGRR